jgi:methionyl-tRNA formyltransferase
MRITLCVLGQKGYQVIESLPDEYLNAIDKVIIGTDRSITNDFSEALTELCRQKNLNAGQNDSIPLESDYVFAIGWRKMISVVGKQTLIVLHDSLLPRYRGFNPLVTALINGDREIGVTAIYGEETYDTGAIIDVEKLIIEYPITVSEVIEKMSFCYSILFNRILDKIEQKDVKAVPQDESVATYSLWRDSQDYRINWEWPSDKIQRMIYAVGNPYNGAKTLVGEKEFTIVSATSLLDRTIENRDIGKVIFKENGKPVVVCGKGLLRLDHILNEEGEQEQFTNQFRLRFT